MVADQHLRCPITKNLFLDPVLTTDGHTYERQAITQYMSMNRYSPTDGFLKNL